MASAIHARCAVRGARRMRARAARPSTLPAPKRAYARKGGTPEHIARPPQKKHIKPLKKSQLCLTQADRFAKIALVLLVLKFERVEIVVILAWR